jgi:DnaK suppressor protein
MSKFANVAAVLTAQLQEMEIRVQRNNAEICAPEDADITEQAMTDANDEPLEALSDAVQAQMAGIKAALARIERGSYGICSNCGVAIHAGRLEAMPTASLCISCAYDADRLHHRL